MSSEKYRGNFYLAGNFLSLDQNADCRVYADRHMHSILGNSPGTNQFTAVEVIAAAKKDTGAYTVFGGLVLEGDGRDLERIEKAHDSIARELIEDPELNKKAYEILEQKLQQRNQQIKEAGGIVLNMLGYPVA